MFAPNCIDYALVFHACALSGIIVSPVAPNFQAAELKQQMQVVIQTLFHVTV
jgi:acyl-CoA synthetase (AMP-forming)/AMP-acid ligase II